MRSGFLEKSGRTGQRSTSIYPAREDLPFRSLFLQDVVSGGQATFGLRCSTELRRCAETKEEVIAKNKT